MTGKESLELITQEKQEDVETLQEIITSLTLQLREKVKRNIQLMEKLKGTAENDVILF